MKNKILIIRYLQGIMTCYFQNDILEGLNYEKEPSILHNIYIGKCKKVVKSMEACFVETECGMCFLPFSECIEKVPCEGDEFPVQIIREPLKSKEAAVSQKLQLSGHYMVLTTEDCHIGVSRKINDSKRRAQLTELFQTLHQNDLPYGIVVRTNADHAEDSELQNEYQKLSEEMKQLLANASHRTCFTCIYKSAPYYHTVIHNQPADSSLQIMTDDREIYNNLKENYQNIFTPDQIIFYQDSMLSLSKLYSLESKINEAISKHVWLKSGGYLVIEQTEAFNVIDVNSGKYNGKKSKDAMIRQTNLEAAKEIARQLKLRNLSGIIIVDFINTSKENEQELRQIFSQYLKEDKIKTTLVDITKLGLFELTRQKQQKSLAEQMAGV